MSKSAAEIEKEIRAALSKCRLMARGFWYEMRHVIESESSTPGELRRGQAPITVEQLADEVRCPATKAQSLTDMLQRVKLIEKTDAGVWYSPRLASLNHQRKRIAKNKAACVDRKDRGLRNPQEGITSPQGNPPGNRGRPSPAPNVSPRTPLPNPQPLPGDSVGCANGSPRAKKRERVLTDEQLGIRDTFTAWFVNEAYPRRHGGVVYDFDAEAGRNAKAVLQIMRHPSVKWSLHVAQEVSERFLDEPDLYLVRRDHRLYDLAQRAGYFLSKLKGVTNVNRPADRGEYESGLAVAVRKV